MLWARLYQRSVSLFALCVLSVAALLPTVWGIWQADAMPWAQEICSSPTSDSAGEDQSSPTSDPFTHRICAACFTSAWAGWIVIDIPSFTPTLIAQTPQALTAIVAAPAAVFWHVRSRAPPRLT